ncbi:hypothetical protein ACIBSW_40305 [Actinoplanes sp. NPDC049668]
MPEFDFPFWLRAVVGRHPLSKFGDGMGGTREDSGYQAINARI